MRVHPGDPVTIRERALEVLDFLEVMLVVVVLALAVIFGALDPEEAMGAPSDGD